MPSPKTLQELAASVGGKVRGDKVEYQVRGPGYKATRYLRLGEEANMNAFSSRPDGKGEVNGKNGVYGKPITPGALVSPGIAKLPGAPTPQNPGNVVGAGNLNLAGSLAPMGYSLDASGKYALSEAKPEDGFSSLFSQYTDAIGGTDMPNNTGLYDKVEKEGRIREKERAVSSYTNELNNITTKAQAESLALEGQGRGITESIIGGQQAQINREAAIQALPVQAKLAAASGDLESARSYVAQRFQLLQQDAQQQYQYKTKLIDTVYNFATGQEQRRLDGLKTKEDQAFKIKMENLRVANDKELATFKAGLEAPAVTPTLALAQGQQGISDVKTLLSDKYLGTAVGPNALARISLFDPFTGGRSNVIAGVEQLRSQLSLDSLVNAKANGATFGALSEGELKLLQESGSKLSSWAQKDNSGNVTGYKASEKDFKNELQKVQNFKTLDFILKGGDPASADALVQPDGTIWVERWDGAFTQIY